MVMPKFRREGKSRTFFHEIRGVTISEDGDSQQEYADSLEMISVNNFSKNDFAHLRGQLRYIASSTRPDVVYRASESSSEQVKILNSSIDHLKKNNLA